MVEEWKDIVVEKNGVNYDYSGLYQVSNMGRVRSLNWHRSGEIKELKLGKNKGYSTVILCKDGKTKSFRVNRLVAYAFIPNPDNLPIVNHIDENKENNCVENLEWVTHKQNMNHGTNIERMTKKNTNRKGSKKVICIETGEVFESINEVQRKLGLSSSYISKCCRGKRKTCGKCHWMYYDEWLAMAN